MKSVQKGFTLIELMIVVAIIAILAAIAIPAYQNYLIRSQVTEGMTLMDGAKTAFTEFYSNRGWAAASTATNGEVGLATAAQIKGKYVSQVEVTGGLIQATFSDATPFKANSAINGGIIELSPITNQGSVAWTCKAVSGVNSKYLPSSCR